MTKGWRQETSAAAVAASIVATTLAPNATESAVANGDTRTISFSNDHTGEEGSFTYMVNGVYDQAALDKLNWFMRDWRLNEPTRMDPRLFDIVWEVYRESGSHLPINVFSAYRSPQTNAMLARMSGGVATNSMHLQGKAADIHLPGRSLASLHRAALHLGRGGVGYYPESDFVHVDTGRVRQWQYG